MTNQTPEVEPEPGTPPFFHDPNTEDAPQPEEPPEHPEPEGDEE